MGSAFGLSRVLIYAGLLPFIAGTLAAVKGVESWWLISDIPMSLAMYSLAIASFMSGIHWGIAQTQEGHSQLLLLSNLMVLLPWFAFAFIGTGAFFYTALAYVFFKQYLLDRGLAKDGVYSEEYLQDRAIVGLSVTFLMLILAVLAMVS